MAPNANQLTRRSASLFNRCPQCFQNGVKAGRSFSSAPRRQMDQQMQISTKDMMSQVGNRQSRRVGMKKMEASNTLDDVGLLPETFIRPPIRQMPGLFGKEWRRRLRIEWHWVKGRFIDFASLIYLYKWQQRKLPKSERPRLGLGQRQAIALDLHKAFYTSLAAGNVKPISSQICTGLATHARTQINQRTHNQTPAQTWTRLGFTSPLSLPFHSRLLFWPLTSLIPLTQAKVVSDRVVPLPFGRSVLMRQCVVRIRSLQKLDRNIPPASAGAVQPVTVADLTEYVVIQQMKGEGTVKQQQSQQAPAHDWMLWGTTSSASAAEIQELVFPNDDEEEQRRQSSSSRLMERLRNWRSNPPRLS